MMPIDGFWLPLLVKLAATVLIVVTASAAAERAGPFWGALIISLPISAGPAYVMLALQADGAFIAQSALASLATNAATVLFLLVLIGLAPRVSALASLAGAVAAWLSAALLLRLVPWTVSTAVALNLGAFLIAFALTRNIKPGPAPDGPARRRWPELVLRALLVGLLVAGVVTVSRAIGPLATGTAAVFPVSLTSLALILHLRLGGQAVAATMASTVRAIPGFALAVLVLHLGASAWPMGLALSAALATSLAWSAGLLARRAWTRAAARSGRVRPRSPAGARPSELRRIE